MHALKVPVCRRWCYTIYLEEVVGVGTFAHAEVHTKWTKLVKEMFASGVHLIKTAHGGPIYIECKRFDTKLMKFISMFGFSHLSTDENGDEIWIWRK